jgi:hypothetical protein
MHDAGYHSHVTGAPKRVRANSTTNWPGADDASLAFTSAPAGIPRYLRPATLASLQHRKEASQPIPKHAQVARRPPPREGFRERLLDPVRSRTSVAGTVLTTVTTGPLLSSFSWHLRRPAHQSQVLGIRTSMR